MADRVLEIGDFAAGYCGRLFVRAGAEVLRLESEPPPAWASSTAMALFLHAGKRRVAAPSADALRALAAQADVVVCEAASADAFAELGLADLNCCVVAVTPFGLSGPKRNWHATPSVLLAMGGYTQIVGDPGRAPLNLPGHYVEFQSGALAFAAAQAARLAGTAGVTDLSMLEVVMSMSQFTTVRWHCAGEVRTRHGSDFYFVVPSDLFRCRDGWVYVNVVPVFWEAFTVFIDQPELVLDERFASNDARRANNEVLKARVAEALADLTRDEIMARAASARVPVGAMLGLDDVLTDAHLAERGSFETLTDGTGAAWRSPGLGTRRDQTRAGAYALAGIDPGPAAW